MLVFNEGVPRSGKSYDAVETHILPALKKGRKVFARLNGLKHAAIAVHLDMPVEEVERLLIHVPEEDVSRIHELAEPNCLVVIDECHGFYPAGERLSKVVEKFFAEHGHHGMDVVFMSQFYKRLHSSLRGRVERKTTFQKLTALKLKGKYLATYYHTVAPDKYEKTGSKTKAYDPAIFPLYDGYAPGTENTEVYEEGGMSVWASVLPWLIVAVVLLLGGGFMYAHFFTAKPKVPEPLKAAAPAKPAVASTGVPVQAKPASVPARPKRPEMPPEASYVWGLSDQGRPRIVALMDLDGGEFDGVIEWRADQSRVIDRLTVKQVRALGLLVERRPYGMKITWGSGKDQQTMIVTAWPVDEPNRYSQQQIADIRSSGPRLPGAADPDMSAGSPGGAPTASSERSWRSGVGAPTYQPPGSMPWNSDPFGASKSAH